MNRSHRTLALWISAFSLGTVLASTAAADMVAPPPPPITREDRAARVATASVKLREMPAMFDQCYARHAGTGAEDAIAVRFDLRADGRAHRVAVTQNGARSRPLAQCLTAALRRFQWQPSRIERVTVTHRFTRPRRPTLATRG